ncbi:uncharacterized protein PAC_02945 [Phialocephala subalpina]|uniref:Uncharacterized protein n=1 Tax=Phialocephala subalpina TaxID=576137 RepID=A0A1L7WJW5_9HELO|nr:uncharacterized protein PAC_02945 [Phialocephala subalpina]
MAEPKDTQSSPTAILSAQTSDATKIMIASTVALHKATSNEMVYQDRIENLSQQLHDARTQLTNSLQQSNGFYRQIIETDQRHADEIELLKIKSDELVNAAIDNTTTRLTAIHNNDMVKIAAAHNKYVKDLITTHDRSEEALSDKYTEFAKSLKAKYDKNRDELKNILEQKAEEDCRALRQANERLTIETKSLRKKVEGFQGMKGEVEPLRKEVSELRKELDAVTKELSTTKSQLSKRTAKYHEIQSSKQSVSDLQWELSMVKKDRDTVRAQLDKEMTKSKHVKDIESVVLKLELELAEANKGLDAGKIQVAELKDNLALAERNLKAFKLQLWNEAKISQETRDTNDYLIRTYIVAVFGSEFLGEKEGDMKEELRKLANDKERTEELVELGRETVENLRGEVKKLKLELHTEEPLVKKGVGIRERFLEQEAKHRDHVKNSY